VVESTPIIISMVILLILAMSCGVHLGMLILERKVPASSVKLLMLALANTLRTSTNPYGYKHARCYLIGWLLCIVLLMVVAQLNWA